MIDVRRGAGLQPIGQHVDADVVEGLDDRQVGRRGDALQRLVEQRDRAGRSGDARGNLDVALHRDHARGGESEQDRGVPVRTLLPSRRQDEVGDALWHIAVTVCSGEAGQNDARATPCATVRQ